MLVWLRTDWEWRMEADRWRLWSIEFWMQPLNSMLQRRQHYDNKIVQYTLMRIPRRKRIGISTVPVKLRNVSTIKS